MNRIILIGNGFDLAHGLQTSYNNFIDWLWKKEFNKIGKLYQKGADKYFNENDFFSISAKFPLDITGECNNFSFKQFKDYINVPSSVNFQITFKNHFLDRLLNNEFYYLQNWVDIEEEYYKALKDCLRSSYKGGIDKLHQDFKQIKNELQTYLTKINDKLEEYKIDFPDTELLGQIYSKPEQINNILFLNFNYTSTHKFYSKEYNKLDRLKIRDTNSIQIHGSIFEIDHNSIVFGYGDEFDDDYKLIEKMNDNRYFENIKMMKYTETNGRAYKALQEYINSDKYQIFLFGHSCGLSDRTLLNMLFMHNNCVSINPFYHKKEDGTNNYNDISRNISCLMLSHFQ